MDRNSPDGAAVVTVVKPSDSSSAPGGGYAPRFPAKEPGRVRAGLGEVEVLAAGVVGSERGRDPLQGPVVCGQHVRAGQDADAERHELAIQSAERALSGLRPGQRPAKVADLRRHQRGARTRAGRCDESVDPGLVEQLALTDIGHRLARVHVQFGDVGRRHHPDRVDDRAQRAQRFGQLVPGGLVAEADQLQHGEALPAQRLGHLGQRRELQDPAHRGDLFGSGSGPAQPGAQDFGGPFPGEEHGARVERRPPTWIRPGPGRRGARDRSRRRAAGRYAAGSHGRATPAGRRCAGALGRDLHPVGTGEVHDGADVVLVSRDRDQLRVLREGRVERAGRGGVRPGAKTSPRRRWRSDSRAAGLKADIGVSACATSPPEATRSCCASC